MPAIAPFKEIRIITIREEVPGFKTFVFESAEPVPYKAGQYLTLLHPHQPDTRRSYSITSAPVLQEPLSIGVKRIANGSFSRWLVDHAKCGDVLRTIGAGGLFVLPEDVDQYQQIFFFAAGSGITPIFSIIKSALHQHRWLSIVLIYSNAAPGKSIFLNELQELEKLFSQQLQVVYLFSNSVQLNKARLHRDLLLQLLSDFSGNLPARHLFYICGPEAYMRLCSYTLQEYGVPKDHIRKENFVTENFKRQVALPPDSTTHTALITIGSQQKPVTVHYPISILDAALQQGMVLPYSCKVGRCGNCVARCTEGTVWHSYNEVLTDKELANGLVLTCVGHPVGGDIKLQF